jgi:hypothetical protein
MRLFFIFLPLLMAACGPKKSMIANPREPEFYDKLVNSAESSPAVQTKLSSVKLLQTGNELPMRFVLFDNKTFYYQVDRLGNGNGTWAYHDGGIRMFANRPFFDLELYLSAANGEGNALVFRFLDRFGFNTVSAALREPASNPQPLPDFTQSDKGI